MRSLQDLLNGLRAGLEHDMHGVSEQTLGGRGTRTTDLISRVRVEGESRG